MVVKIHKLCQALIRSIIIDNTSDIDFQPHPAHRKLYEWPCIHHTRNGRLLTHIDLVEKERISFSTCAPDGHLLTVTMTDAVLISFDPLRMCKILLETCTC